MHAGSDLTLDDWHETTDTRRSGSENHSTRSRKSYWKTIVFGHTPVYGLLEQKPGTADLWVTEDGKVGMDGRPSMVVSSMESY